MVYIENYNLFRRRLLKCVASVQMLISSLQFNPERTFKLPDYRRSPETPSAQSKIKETRQARESN